MNPFRSIAAGFGFAVMLDVRGRRGRTRIRTITRHRVVLIRSSRFEGYSFCKDCSRAGSALWVDFKGCVYSLIGSVSYVSPLRGTVFRSSSRDIVEGPS
jgi:hypothetical protein